MRSSCSILELTTERAKLAQSQGGTKSNIIQFGSINIDQGPTITAHLTDVPNGIVKARLLLLSLELRSFASRNTHREMKLASSYNKRTSYPMR